MDPAVTPLDEPGRLEEAAAIPVATRWIGSWRFSLQRRAMSVRELRASGLEDARCVSLKGHGFLHRLSVACAGRKPAERLHAVSLEAA
jgi:hypothetical protein